MAGAEIVNVGDTDFQKLVLEATEPVMVDFWATWCAPCRAIAPVLEDLAGEYKGKLTIAKLNIDEHQGVAQRYGIRSIPTLLVFKGGKVVEQIVGAVPKAKLQESIRKVI